MVSILFIVSVSVLCAAMLVVGCKYLPDERWQVLAAVPTRSCGGGRWQGVNFTFYGLLTANAYLMALVMLVVLLRAVDVPLSALMTLALAILAVCVPASKWVAYVVEGKAHTFTVGGAVFVGIVVAPWLIAAINLVVERPIAMMPTLAALGIAYAMGEGLGRLACISFGCCYGKPVSACGPLAQRLFSRFHFVFTGANKKIAYASGLNGQAVVPIQAITAILYVTTAILGTVLFVVGAYVAVFLLTVIVTQGWRVYSEMLRADYRGDNSFSAYQWMGVVGIVYVVAVSLICSPATVPLAQIGLGVRALWNPLVILVFQAVWLTLFWYTGKSSVTGALLSFHIHPEKV